MPEAQRQELLEATNGGPDIFLKLFDGQVTYASFSLPHSAKAEKVFPFGLLWLVP